MGWAYLFPRGSGTWLSNMVKGKVTRAGHLSGSIWFDWYIFANRNPWTQALLTAQLNMLFFPALSTFLYSYFLFYLSQVMGRGKLKK